MKFTAYCQFSRLISSMLAQTMKHLASIGKYSGLDLGRVTNYPKVSVIFLSSSKKIPRQHFKSDNDHFPVHYSLFIHAVIRQYFFSVA
jgi:hypothetical protein